MTVKHIRITGKVQGVWYRASAKDKAIQLGLTGQVWNEANGDVSAVVQGEEESVTHFIDWCWQGPPLANVSKVEVFEISAEEDFTSFEIVKR